MQSIITELLSKLAPITTLLLSVGGLVLGFSLIAFIVDIVRGHLTDGLLVSSYYRYQLGAAKEHEQVSRGSDYWQSRLDYMSYGKVDLQTVGEETPGYDVLWTSRDNVYSAYEEPDGLNPMRVMSLGESMNESFFDEEEREDVL